MGTGLSVAVPTAVQGEASHGLQKELLTVVDALHLMQVSQDLLALYTGRWLEVCSSSESGSGFTLSRSGSA